MINNYPPIVLTNLQPQIQGGRYFIKKTCGEQVAVSVDILKDGHDILEAEVLWRKENTKKWHKNRLTPVENNSWKGSFAFSEKAALGFYEFTVEAYVNDFLSWLSFFNRKSNSDSKNLSSEIEQGKIILLKSLKNYLKSKKKGFSMPTDLEKFLVSNDLAEENINLLKKVFKFLNSKKPAKEIAFELNKPNIRILLAKYSQKSCISRYKTTQRLWLDRKKASFSSWYEYFPRNAIADGKTHANFKQQGKMLQYIADLGFDVVYLPPIHPIGETNRKGKNNSLECEIDDVGSPWAIGSKYGGYRKIEPKLGTLKDFKNFIKEAKKLNLEVAIDFALNCSPDHPYVRDHPEWFFKRPDGTIRYAENPPKKYQDIYPLNFNCKNKMLLWQEIVDVMIFWVKTGIKIFRVDNPHTKPISFWKFLIKKVHSAYLDVILLSEAFTMPKMMYELARIGFSQSYSYFTWRINKFELGDYIGELNDSEIKDYFRANFWPNTPDILPWQLQHAPMESFKIRAVLAATLTSSWGIFSGFELCENKPFVGKEEYEDSDKYQLKKRNFSQSHNIKPLIRRLNQIRQKFKALQIYGNARIVNTNNENILACLRSSGNEHLLIIINLDPYNLQECKVEMPLDFFGKKIEHHYKIIDHLGGGQYQWRGVSNFVSLNPNYLPAHIFELKI